ncbi:translocase of inner membrane 10 [Dermatophagoides farinae]|uniref:Mitochondrial import inner membrane translocase subunit n=1 Tax=Dermatophagoides farinae TaxID=6954 RepID=A0A922HQX6_DERFA|nr:Mitochondrial import inner membrane translocase subunit Tim10 [Dermatophagoides farinae]
MATPQFNLDPSKMQIINELEVEMVADMYNRMTRACRLKCIVRKYKDSELSKGESVCIDRCVAKYLDIHDKIGKKLNSLSRMDEEAAKKLQLEQQVQQTK